MSLSFSPPSSLDSQTKTKLNVSYGHVLHTKFRFRSATFFKTSRLELASEKHKDRVLVTGLRTLPPATGVPSSQATPSQSPPPPPGTERTEEQEPSKDVDSSNNTDALPSNPGVSPVAEHPATAAAETSGISPLGVEGSGKAGDVGGASNSSGKGRLVMVVNCHLTGGPAPERRMRQVLDGLDAARKDAAKLLSEEAAAASKGKKKGGGGGGKKKGEGGAAAAAPGTSVPVVVCGDLNSNNGRTAVCELLSTGVVEASFREGGYPEVGFSRAGVAFFVRSVLGAAGRYLLAGIGVAWKFYGGGRVELSPRVDVCGVDIWRPFRRAFDCVELAETLVPPLSILAHILCAQVCCVPASPQIADRRQAKTCPPCG